jgi:hypothetical protein
VTTLTSPSLGSKFLASTDNVHFWAIAQLQRFVPSGSKQTIVDQTNILTPDNFTRSLAVRVDSGEIDMVGILDPQNPNILQLGQLHANLTLAFFKIVLTDGTTYTFQGFVAEYVPFSVDHKKALGFTCKVRVSGAYSGPLGNA